MGNSYDGVFCLPLGGDDRGGWGPALAVDAVEGEKVEAGQGRGLRSVLLSRRNSCPSRRCSGRPRGSTGNPRGSARGAQAAASEGTGVGAVPGEFILILVWAIRMTSCFVHRSWKGSYGCSSCAKSGRRRSRRNTRAPTPGTVSGLVSYPGLPTPSLSVTPHSSFTFTIN